MRISGLGPASAGGRLRYDPGSSIHTGFAAERSTIHTDALYASKAREFIERAGVDTVMIEDTSGILTPERARTLIPAIKAAIGERPLAGYEVAGVQHQDRLEPRHVVLHAAAVLDRLSRVVLAVHVDHGHRELRIVHRLALSDVPEVPRHCFRYAVVRELRSRCSRRRPSRNARSP